MIINRQSSLSEISQKLGEYSEVFGVIVDSDREQFKIMHEILETFRAPSAETLALTVGQKVTISPDYKYASEWPGEYFVTQIRWEFQTGDGLDCSIAIASADDIQHRYGDTTDFAPKDLVPVRLAASLDYAQGVQNLAPLPWSIDKNNIGKLWTDSISIKDADGGHVAHLTRGYEGYSNGIGRPSFKNAELIVSAVNRLAASPDYAQGMRFGIVDGNRALVPVEPTEDMLDAACNEKIHLNVTRAGWRKAWFAMIRALPVPDGREEIQSSGALQGGDDVRETPRAANSSGQEPVARIVPLKNLAAMLSLLPPKPVEVNGSTFAYQDPNAAERLNELRAVFDALLNASPLYAAPPSLDREAVARIIDPSGFNPNDLAHEPFYIDLWKRRALEKADAILSLNTGAGQTRADIIEECAEVIINLIENWRVSDAEPSTALNAALRAVLGLCPEAKHEHH